MMKCTLMVSRFIPAKDRWQKQLNTWKRLWKSQGTTSKASTWYEQAQCLVTSTMKKWVVCPFFVEKLAELENLFPLYACSLASQCGKWPWLQDVAQMRAEAELEMPLSYSSGGGGDTPHQQFSIQGCREQGKDLNAKALCDNYWLLPAYSDSPLSPNSYFFLIQLGGLPGKEMKILRMTPQGI